MANAAHTNSDTTQEVGSVFILYGTVKAVSPEGFERILKPNSPIFANDRIMTGPDGRISVVFIDGQTQLDLGRMSDVLIDSDVYAALTPEESIDTAAQVGDIQQALEDEDFDPTQELEEPAAGDTGAGEGGGGHPYVVFEANQMEVTPDSGAETTGISTSFLEPPPVDIVEEEEETGELIPDDELPPPATPPDEGRTVNQPQDLKPIAVDDKNEVVEGFRVITGNVYDNDTDGTPATTLTSVTIDGVEIEIPANGSVTRLTDLGGELTINSDGTYSYTILTNILHEANGQGDGLDDFETFSYTITDANGDTSTATLTIDILDTAPLAHPDGNTVTEGGVATVGDGQDSNGNQVEGNVIFGWDDGVYVPASADEQSADQGLHLVNVTGDFADGVVFAFDTELATSQGGTIVFSSNGSYVYTAPSAVNNPLDSDGNNLAVPEQFQYSVEDADGSPSSAVLTINIEDTAPTANSDVATVEEGDRTPGDGSNNQVSGNVILADQNGPGEGGIGPVADVADIDGADGGTHLVSVSGDFADNVVFALDTELATAQGGTIIFSGDGSYTYTAPDSIDHSDAVADAEQFTYTIADSDGSEASAGLSINITDTAPTALDDIDSIVDGQGNTTYGNVITGVDPDTDPAYNPDGLAADNLNNDSPHTVAGITFSGTTVTFADNMQTDANGNYIEIEGDHGVLRMYESGSYGYTSNGDADHGVRVGDNLVQNPGFEADDVPQWMVFGRDSDGRTSSTEEVTGWGSDLGPGIEIQDQRVMPGDSAEGEQHIELDSHYGRDTNSNAFQEIPTGEGANYELSFAYTPRPGTGNRDESTNDIEVYWDGELIDTVSGEPGAAMDWQTYTYTVPAAADGDARLEFRAAGADDSVGGFIDDVAVYELQPVADTFTYILEDVDGSTSEADLTINLADGFGGSVDSGVVSESALDQGGTDPASNAENWLNGQIVVESDGEGFVLNVGGTDVLEDGTQIQGAHGTLTVDLDGGWSYVLESSTDAHSRAGATGEDDVVQGESFAVTVSSPGGAVSHSIGDLTIDIQDDGPVFGETQDAILVNEQENSVTGDLDLTFGGDGPADIASLQLFGPDGQVLNGQPVVNQAGQRLTFNDGEEMVYTSDGRGGVIAVGAQSGVEVFTVGLDPQTGTYTVSLGDEQLDGGVGEEQFSVQFPHPEGRGGALSHDIQTDDNPAVYIHATAEYYNGQEYVPELVNWHVHGLGVASEGVGAYEGEYVNSGERLVLDFFNQDDEELALREASIELSGLDEGEPPETASWAAFNADGQEVGRGSVEGQGGGHAHSSDQFIIISEQDTGGQTFTTVHLYSDGGFKLEGMSGTYGGEDHALDYDVVATDNDGDTAETAIQVTFDAGGIVDGGEAGEAISGSPGSDIISGGGGDDVIDGGDGDDVIDGGAGDDEIRGGEGDDTLIGGESGNDRIDGEGGYDVIRGNDGEDIIAGGSEDDVLMGGDGADSIDGGEGEDRVTYTGDDSPGITVNLQGDSPETGGEAEGDTITGVEHVTGGSGDDTLIGDEGDNTLQGGPGEDNLDGGSGNDTLIGGEGSDSFQAQEVADETTDYDDSIDTLVPPVEP